MSYKSLLFQSPGVFDNMENFAGDPLSQTGIKLQFAKFAKGFTTADLMPFVKEHIGEGNLVFLGRQSHPNEWALQVKTDEIRERLIRLGRTKINSRTCWLSPLSQTEVRGYVHWFPNEVSNEKIKAVLGEYGEVQFIEVQKTDLWPKVDSDVRYFCVRLRNGRTMDDIPHFFKLEGYHGLITIKGRSPACFHCRTVGHRKSECQIYKEKLNSYCMRQSTGKKRAKPRGKRYKPSLNPNAKSKNKKASSQEVKKSETSKEELRSDATTKLPSSSDSNIISEQVFESDDASAKLPSCSDSLVIPEQVFESEDKTPQSLSSSDCSIDRLKNLLDKLELLPEDEKSLKLKLISKILNTSCDKKKSDNQEKS